MACWFKGAYGFAAEIRNNSTSQVLSALVRCDTFLRLVVCTIAIRLHSGVVDINNEVNSHKSIH